MQKLTLIILVFLALASCQQNQPDQKNQDAAAQMNGEPISSEALDQQKKDAEKSGVNFSDSDLVGSAKGVIKGKNVPVKGGPTFSSETLGTYDEDEKIDMIGYQVVRTEGEGILLKPVTLSGKNGSITLSKGKSVLIERSNEAQNTVLVFQDDPAKGRFEAEVKTDVFETRMYAVWHQVKRANGNVTWVLGKYLQQLR